MGDAQQTRARPRAERVRRCLLDLMASGDYPDGAKLPTERDLAGRLNLPRGAVRDALASLETEGAVVRVVGSGTFVASPVVAPGARPLPLRDVSPAEIMEARMLIEPRLASLAVAQATAADFERMETCNREALASGSLGVFEHWDAALHQAIAEATHNRLVVGLYDAITAAREHADWGELKRRSLTPERREVYREEHRRIVAALRARDAAAAEAEVLAHLKRVRENLLGY